MGPGHGSQREHRVLHGSQLDLPTAEEGPGEFLTCFVFNRFKMFHVLVSVFHLSYFHLLFCLPVNFLF